MAEGRLHFLESFPAVCGRCGRRYTTFRDPDGSLSAPHECPPGARPPAAELRPPREVGE